jgi:hypothetical protein
VLMTQACNLPEGFVAGAAIEISPEPAALANQLVHTLGGIDSSERLRAMGEAGEGLVRRRFNQREVGRQFLELYRWLAQGGARPEFVSQT